MGQPAKTCTTRFAACSRWQAAMVLAVTAAVSGLFLWVALTQETVPTSAPETRSDAEFYRAIVDRVHSGQGYYQAVDQELRLWDFQPYSIFNWRFPLYAWLFGHLPAIAWGQALLGLGILATMILGYLAICQDDGNVKAVATVLLLIGPFEWVLFENIALFTELWSGMLITLSICAYAHKQRRLGFAAGLLALFFRELALPYVVIALVLALWEKRRREAIAWLGGLAAFGLYLTFHAMQASRFLTGGQVVNAQGWLQFNGPAFALLTSQVNYFLLQGPSWVAALYLSLSFLGLAGWRNPMGVRAGLTAAAFVAAFHIVGMKPANAYWGLMYIPLLPFGLVWAPAALRDLVVAVIAEPEPGFPRFALQGAGEPGA